MLIPATQIKKSKNAGCCPTVRRTILSEKKERARREAGVCREKVLGERTGYMIIYILHNASNITLQNSSSSLVMEIKTLVQR